MVNKIVSLLLAGVVFTSSSIQLSDAKNGGNIAERNKYSEDKEYWRIAELEAGLQSEDGEITEDLYNPLALTVSKGILDSETEWDSTITKSEGVELVVEVARQCTSIKTYGCRMGTIEGSDGLVDADTVENTVEANAGAGYIPDGADKDFAMQEEAATQEEMEANGEVATPVGEFIEESVATVYSAAPQSEVENDTKADTTTTKPETTKAKTTSTKKKVVVTKIASKKMYVKKKVSTYKEPSSTAKKVKTLNKGKSVVVIGKATDSKGRAWYQIKTTSGKQFIIASALSKTKPKTTSATTGNSSSNSSSSTSNQNNNSNSSSSTSSTSKEYTRENYKTHPVYKKLPASERKKIDKIMNTYDITYSEMAYICRLVDTDIVVEWANDGDSWEQIVARAERASGDYILE